MRARGPVAEPCSPGGEGRSTVATDACVTTDLALWAGAGVSSFPMKSPLFRMECFMEFNYIFCLIFKSSISSILPPFLFMKLKNVQNVPERCSSELAVQKEIRVHLSRELGSGVKTQVIYFGGGYSGDLYVAQPT